jgi:hypothetical protein
MRAASEHEYTAANDAEEEAITAVCGYVCRRPVDGALKAKYLRRSFNQRLAETPGDQSRRNGHHE